MGHNTRPTNQAPFRRATTASGHTGAPPSNRPPHTSGRGSGHSSHSPPSQGRFPSSFTPVSPGNPSRPAGLQAAHHDSDFPDDPMMLDPSAWLCAPLGDFEPTHDMIMDDLPTMFNTGSDMVPHAFPTSVSFSAAHFNFDDASISNENCDIAMPGIPPGTPLAVPAPDLAFSLEPPCTSPRLHSGPVTPGFSSVASSGDDTANRDFAQFPTDGSHNSCKNTWVDCRGCIFCYPHCLEVCAPCNQHHLLHNATMDRHWHHVSQPTPAYAPPTAADSGGLSVGSDMRSWHPDVDEASEPSWWHQPTFPSNGTSGLSCIHYENPSSHCLNPSGMLDDEYSDADSPAPTG